MSDPFTWIRDRVHFGKLPESQTPERKLIGKEILLDGAEERQFSIVERVFANRFAFKKTIEHDRTYLQLSRESLEILAAWYWDGSRLEYHGNSEEFPDCDDFSVIAFGRILDGAIKEGLGFPPLFGLITLKHRQRGLHQQIFAIAGPEGALLLFEPQTGKWTADLSTVERVVEVVI